MYPPGAAVTDNAVTQEKIASPSWAVKEVNLAGPYGSAQSSLRSSKIEKIVISKWLSRVIKQINHYLRMYCAKSSHIIELVCGGRTVTGSTRWERPCNE